MCLMPIVKLHGRSSSICGRSGLEHDIRYTPLSYDGVSQKHWTALWPRSRANDIHWFGHDYMYRFACCDGVIVGLRTNNQYTGTIMNHFVTTSTPSANAQNRSLEYACARSLVARVRIAPLKSNVWALVFHPRSNVVAPFVRTPLHPRPWYSHA